MRGPIIWGVVWGGIQAASPLVLWWLDAATVYALGLALIVSVYIGFAVADRRWLVIAVESNVVAMFVIVAAAAVEKMTASELVRAVADLGLTPSAAERKARR